MTWRIFRFVMSIMTFHGCGSVTTKGETDTDVLETDAPVETEVPDTDPPVDTDEPAGVCSFTASLRACPHDTVTLTTGSFVMRDVHFQAPAGVPPEDGWPVALLFQGSFFSAERFWEAQPLDPFGAWQQTGTVAALLDAGYAVVTPEALGGGSTFWNTNVPPWSLAWETSPDHALMLAIFAGLEDGTFGEVDPARLYAGGISSGGYMTSRMALSYPGRFRALAIQSASWATCSGALCFVPQVLPADHPPTLFLHGELDVIVPITTMDTYAERLGDGGFSARVVRDATAGHEWIPAAPDEVVDWFGGHP